MMNRRYFLKTLAFIPAAVKAATLYSGSVTGPIARYSGSLTGPIARGELGTFHGFEFVTTETIMLPPKPDDRWYDFIIRYWDPKDQYLKERTIGLNRLRKAPSRLINISNGLEIPLNAEIQLVNVIPLDLGSPLSAHINRIKETL